jgi:hypothetical protein
LKTFPRLSLAEQDDREVVSRGVERAAGELHGLLVGGLRAGETRLVLAGLRGQREPELVLRARGFVGRVRDLRRRVGGRGGLVGIAQAQLRGGKAFEAAEALPAGVLVGGAEDLPGVVVLLLREEAQPLLDESVDVGVGDVRWSPSGSNGACGRQGRGHDPTTEAAALDHEDSV